MSLLEASRIGFQYALLDPLFEHVTFTINPGDRIALVGPNGAGKTTLLRILAGELEPDQGSLARRRGLTAQSFSQTQASGARRLSAGVRAGGALERCLAADADLLLLDEPTNHLDIDARAWLATQLKRQRGACVAVSHDHWFLEEFATRVFEVERGMFREYSGGYAFYECEKRRRGEREWNDYEASERRQAVLERAAEHRAALSRSATVAPHGQRDARGSKPFYAAKAARLARTARLLRERGWEEAVAGKPWEEAPIQRLTFPESPRCGDPPFEFAGVTKAYGSKVVFRDFNWQCRRGDRWALRGPNGSGKTTLLRLLLGVERPDAGVVRVAPNVRTAYYAQEAENIPPERSALAICAERCGDETRIRTLLACMKLPRALVTQAVGALSPGERAKVALVRVLLENANLLLLDEPTNHLEIEAQRALEATLRDYPGTVVFVSHDRRFLEDFASRTLELGG